MCKKKLNCEIRKINIAITRIPNDYRDPSCRNYSQTIKKLNFVWKAIKKAIELAKAGIKRSSSSPRKKKKGVQVQIAGCIDGKEIALVYYSNGLEKVEFLYRPFELKLIAPIQFWSFFTYYIIPLF